MQRTFNLNDHGPDDTECFEVIGECYFSCVLLCHVFMNVLRDDV